MKYKVFTYAVKIEFAKSVIKGKMTMVGNIETCGGSEFTNFFNGKHCLRKRCPIFNINGSASCMVVMKKWLDREETIKAIGKL